MDECTSYVDLLSPFERDELDGELHRRVHDHLATCPSCAEAVRQYRELSALVESARSAPVDDVPRSLIRSLKKELQNSRSDEVDGSPPPLPEILTLDEVAAYLRIEIDDLEDEIATMPVFELGGRIRMRRSALLEWINDKEQRARRRFFVRTAHDGGL